MPGSNERQRTCGPCLSDSEWDEIVSLGFEPFEPEPHAPMTYRQWMAVAEMALGKAIRIERGDYGPPEPSERTANKQWADELRQIAKKIFIHFLGGEPHEDQMPGSYRS